MERKELERRLTRIFESAKGAERILVANTDHADPNFIYLTGFTSGLFEYSYIVAERDHLTCFTSALEYSTAVEQAGGNIKVVKIDKIEEFRAQMRSLVNGKTVGINETFMPVSMFKAIKKRYKPKKLIDVSKAFEEARLVKSESEIAEIRQAARITKMAIVMAQKELKEGMTELALSARFDSISASLGSEEPAFKTIVCFGKNAAVPHHSPDETKLRYGDLVLIDAGAKVHNYCSDITRTIIFGDDKDLVSDYGSKEEVLKIVKAAQLKAIKKVKPGVTGAAVHNVAQKLIDTVDSGAYKGTFIHALGHSLGIEVHDGPGFSPGARQKLKPGMVITAEPGIYIDGFGGVRIEDDVLVTEDGAVVL